MLAKYKYIHILCGRDTKFSGKLVRFFNEKELDMKPENHLFITPYVEVYNELKDFGNVELDNSGDNLYLKYHKNCDWIISHAFILKDVLFTPRKILKKTILRYWGGSRTTRINKTYNPYHLMQYFIKRLVFKYLMESFAAIGVANVIDIIDLDRVLKNVKYYIMPYVDSKSYTAIMKVINSKSTNTTSNVNTRKIVVFVGNAGRPESNHLTIVEKLAKFSKDKVDIIVPLSYGHEEYIQSTIIELEKRGYSNVRILKELLPFDKYVELVSNVDIGIFDGIASHALGNVASFLDFKKTIFINRDGIIKKAFDIEEIPYHCIDELDSMDFDDFSRLLKYPCGFTTTLKTQTIEETVEMWRKLLNDFK